MSHVTSLTRRHTRLRQGYGAQAEAPRHRGWSSPSDFRCTRRRSGTYLARLWACRGAAPSEHADSGRSRKASRAIHRREFVPRDPYRGNRGSRCMPRWLLLGLSLLAAGANEFERRELSRRAESAPRTGRPAGDSTEAQMSSASEDPPLRSDQRGSISAAPLSRFNVTTVAFSWPC